MIAFDQVQPALAGLIRAHTMLADITVTEDLGTNENEAEIELALQEEAVSISVTVPVHGKKADLKGGKAILDVQVLVLITLNSVRNDRATNPDALELKIYDLVKNVAQAVLDPSVKVLNPQDRFGLADDALRLDVLDAGVFRYQFTFLKACVL